MLWQADIDAHVESRVALTDAAGGPAAPKHETAGSTVERTRAVRISESVSAQLQPLVAPQLLHL